MTPEEMERAIGIILNNQANFETRLERTSRQVEETSRQLGETNRRVEETNLHVQELSRGVEETNLRVQELSRKFEETTRRLDIFTETQTEFIQVVMRHIEAQGEINSSMRNAVGG